MEEPEGESMGQYFVELVVATTAVVIIGHAINNGMKAESTVAAIVAVYDTLVVDMLASPVITAAAIAHAFRILRLLLEDTEVPDFIDRYGNTLFQSLNNLFGLLQPADKKKLKALHQKQYKSGHEINKEEDVPPPESNSVIPLSQPELQTNSEQASKQHHRKRRRLLTSLTTTCEW